MLREAESGARSRKSINVVRPSARRISMKPPPPMLPALGWVTASASPTATAASMALPPFFRTSSPTTVAWRSRETTMPWRARTGWAAQPGTDAAISSRANVWRIHSILLCGPGEDTGCLPHRGQALSPANRLFHSLLTRAAPIRAATGVPSGSGAIASDFAARRWNFALPREFHQLAPADHAGLMLVAAGTLPVGLQTEPSLVAIARQGVHLPAPPDHPIADGAPHRLVPVHGAILGMHVLNSRHRQLAVAFGESLLAGHDGVGRVPDHFQIGVIERGQHPRGLRPGSDIAGVLVFQADDHTVWRGLIGQGAQGFHDAVEADFRIHRAPVREHADDARASPPRNLQGARREPGLIGERMLGGEHILLEAGIDFRRVGQHALQQRRRDGENLQARAAHDCDGAVQFFIAQVDDVFAEHHAEFGARHAKLGHGADGDFDIRRELVGDGGDWKMCGHESSL